MVPSKLLVTLTALGYVQLVASFAVPHGDSTSNFTSATISTLYEFPQPTFIENIAVRSNGEILFTTLGGLPELHGFSPNNHRVVHHFSGYNSALAIHEICPDVFAVVTGNYSLQTFQPTPGSFAVWRVAFKGKRLSPLESKLSTPPEASFINGMTELLGGDLLLSDSTLGVVFRLNVKSGSLSKVMDDPIMKFTPGASPEIGVNGIRTESILGKVLRILYCDLHKHSVPSPNRPLVRASFRRLRTPGKW
ncbi:unnamed protein product [Alternaria burnsii]|nr:unnamed protein product [Alternaria burnsii]